MAMRVVQLTGVMLGAGALGALTLAACTMQAPQEVSGRALYQDYCQTCHGESGKGDGPAASALKKRPADLTTIAKRNGGTFPLVKVMSTIDGYTCRNDHGSIMPEMGPVIEGGQTVMITTDDGIDTQVPEPLLALAQYVATLQVK